jgi:hypothetical protein
MNQPKAVTIEGPPGFPLAVFNRDPDYGMQPTCLLAHGHFNGDGLFCTVIPAGNFDEIQTTVYRPGEAPDFEANGHVNTNPRYQMSESRMRRNYASVDLKAALKRCDQAISTFEDAIADEVKKKAELRRLIEEAEAREAKGK